MPPSDNFSIGFVFTAGGGVDFLFTGVSADSGLAILYTSKNGFEAAFIGNQTAKVGYGVAGSLYYNGSLVLGAQSINDFKGGVIGYGLDSEYSFSKFSTIGSGGQNVDTYSGSFGFGTGLFLYGGVTKTWIIPIEN
ncbi:MAG: hypothetical protein ABL930_12485 [Pseudobdellovibrio sp.]